MRPGDLERKGGKRLLSGAKKAGGAILNAGKKVWKRTPGGMLAKKIGDIGGIDYHKTRNVLTGVTANVRGNRAKQSLIPGFNAPDKERFAAANNQRLRPGTSKGLAHFNNALNYIVAPLMGKQVSTKKSKPGAIMPGWK